MRAVLAAEGVGIIKAPVRAPPANAISEGAINTLRRPCLDRVPILGRRRLEVVLANDVGHCESHCPHGFFGERAPPALDANPALIGDVELARPRRTNRLAGIIHEYRIVATVVDGDLGTHDASGHT